MLIPQELLQSGIGKVVVVVVVVLVVFVVVVVVETTDLRIKIISEKNDLKFSKTKLLR